MRTTCTTSWWRTKGARCCPARSLAGAAHRRRVARREGLVQRFVQEIFNVLSAALVLLVHVRRRVRAGWIHRPTRGARSAERGTHQFRSHATAADGRGHPCVGDRHHVALQRVVGLADAAVRLEGEPLRGRIVTNGVHGPLRAPGGARWDAVVPSAGAAAVAAPGPPPGRGALAAPAAVPGAPRPRADVLEPGAAAAMPP